MICIRHNAGTVCRNTAKRCHIVWENTCYVFDNPQTDYTRALLGAALDHAVAAEGVVSE